MGECYVPQALTWTAPDLVLSNLAAFLRGNGFLQHANKVGLKVLELSEKVNSRRDIALNLCVCARINTELGQIQEALRYFQRGIPLLRKENQEQLLSVALKDFGVLLQANGQHKEAEAVLIEAVDMYEKLHSNPAECFDALGVSVQNQGDTAKAATYYQASMNNNERFYGKSSPHTAISKSQLGIALIYLNEVEKGTEYVESALPIMDTHFPPPHQGVAAAYHNAGNAFRSIGKFQKAQFYLETALARRNALYPPNNPNVASSHLGLGELYYHTGKPEEAKKHLEQALPAFINSYGKGHQTVLKTLYALSQTYKKLGQQRLSGISLISTTSPPPFFCY